MTPRALEEKRKEPRFPRTLPVRFGTPFRTFGGTVEDLSKEGMRIRSLETLPPNADLMVFVLFPRHTVCLHARVAWINDEETLMGLALIPPQPTLVEDYRQWLAEVRQAAAA